MCQLYYSPNGKIGFTIHSERDRFQLEMLYFELRTFAEQNLLKFGMIGMNINLPLHFLNINIK